MSEEAKVSVPEVDDVAPEVAGSVDVVQAGEAQKEMPGGVEAETVVIKQGGAETVRAVTVTVEQGGIARAEAKFIDVAEGGIALAMGENMTVKEGGVAVAVADSVQVEEGVVVFAAANKIAGKETTVIFDMRAAIVCGMILGVVSGLLRKLFREKK